MHALHSLAHRAPPATRTRVRWQPYNSIPSSSSCSSISSRSPSATYLNTPASSVTSSPPVTTPSVEFDRIRQTLHSSSTSQVLKDSTIRDPTRNKHAIGLVDQAVKSLSEIWRPQDIPTVFLTSPRGMVGASYEPALLAEQKPLQQHRRNTQLPSPVSPCTQPSPIQPSSSTAPPASIQRCSQAAFQDSTAPGGSRSNLVPIKGFVHEVLRRSRTSGCVLQTALCYLEAIRSKVPELANQEKTGHSATGEPALADRIILATDAELALEAEFDMCLDSIVKTEKYTDEDSMDTVRISDDGPDDHFNISVVQERATPSNQPMPSIPASLPPLPSPLLCPRRAFLASLILASKFTQDKCYSNRAWAKLSGLPPREIGRCERALGEALEWRLWVGKLPIPQVSSSPAIASVTRPVVRSQSEHSLFSSTANQPFLVQTETSTPLSVPSPLGVSNHSGLRRCSTLPADAYATQPDQGAWCAPNISVQGNYAHYTQSPDAMNPASTSFIKPFTTSTSLLSTATYADQIISSPSPDTPGLSYSPSSTESSSGDRTIQMSTFLDDSMAPFNPSIGIVGTESWLWLDNPDGLAYYSKALLSTLPGNINKPNPSGPRHPTSFSTPGWENSLQVKPSPYIEPNQPWGENIGSLLCAQ